MLRINDLTQLYLGIQGENKSRTIVIDVADWLVSYPNGSLSIWIKRPGDATATATGAVFDAEEKTLTWQPDAVDTYVAGEGTAEIRLTEGTVIKKTREIRIAVSPAVTGGGGTLGSDWQSYINEVDRLKSLATAAATAAEASALDAEEAKGEAVTAAEEAEQDAQAAEEAKEAAVAAKDGIEEARDAAIAAKNAAEGSATAAAGSATAAAGSATAAAGSATAAEGSATAAAGSATSAAENAETAENAKNAAVAAKTAAEAARDVALTMIDDTAGAGDTDKAWSADKSTKEVTDLKDAIDLQNTVVTDKIGEVDNYSVQLTLEETVGGIQSTEIGDVLTFSQSQNYTYTRVIITSDNYTVSYRASASVTYPYYIYLTDSMNRVIAKYGTPAPNETAFYAIEIDIPLGAYYLYAMSYGGGGGQTKVAKREYNNLQSQINTIDGKADEQSENITKNKAEISLLNAYNLHSKYINNPSDLMSRGYTIVKQYLTLNNHEVKDSELMTSVIVQCDPATNYFVKKDTETHMRVGSFQSYPITGAVANAYVSNSDAKSGAIQITTGEEDNYLFIQLYTDADTEQIDNPSIDNIITLTVSPDTRQTLLTSALLTIGNLNRDKRFLNFAFVTDTHVYPESDNFACLNNIELFVEASKFADFSIHCGDVVESGNMQSSGYGAYNTTMSRSDNIAHLKTAMEKLSLAHAPLYIVRGNHDTNTYGRSKTQGNVELSSIVYNTEWNVFTQGYREDVAYDPQHPFLNYFYKDYDLFKIRIIVLNQYVDETTGADKDYGDEQSLWFAHTALNFSDKDNDGTDWAVICFAHGSFFRNIRLIIPFFTDALSGTVTFPDTQTECAMDYTNQAKIPFIFIHGDTHEDSYYNNYGFNNIGVDQSFVKLWLEESTDEIGTENEYCVDYFTIDTEKKIIYETRMGRGDSRSYHYGVNSADNYQIT